MWRDYEHKNEALLPINQFLRRLFNHVLLAIGFMAAALLIGVLGYHLTEHFGWLDAVLNASMILGGMGPVDPVQTPAGKVFASFYALFSGVVFLAIAGIIVAPIAHRLLHRLHIETDEASADRGSGDNEKH